MIAFRCGACHAQCITALTPFNPPPFEEEPAPEAAAAQPVEMAPHAASPVGTAAHAASPVETAAVLPAAAMPPPTPPPTPPPVGAVRAMTDGCLAADSFAETTLPGSCSRSVQLGRRWVHTTQKCRPNPNLRVLTRTLCAKRPPVNTREVRRKPDMPVLILAAAEKRSVKRPAKETATIVVDDHEKEGGGRGGHEKVGGSSSSSRRWGKESGGSSSSWRWASSWSEAEDEDDGWRSRCPGDKKAS